ncbi:MAG TPA: UDP-3-O-(3-hydroxymyristoyl)glucosamine N-acyltransferase [Rhizomicrobium sp.]|jgi:UDP-3-O-[3-hydroxymyristoyl] glucosamine N-acyltransferase|nr:UDP-3-O-(3-hydroxymyristoyl)glucosamine N-acyltransferase [Rhizomicrobium sp.]
MADPRFFDNCGPISLRRLCESLGVDEPAGANGEALVADVASLEAAGPSHLAFFSGDRRAEARAAFRSSGAGYCLAPKGLDVERPHGCVLLLCSSPSHAFAQAARLFYPDSGLDRWRHPDRIDPSAALGEDVELAPGATIGPGARIGARTRIGPNTAIGRGVTIGRDCEIGANVTISHALIGDRVTVLSGAQIGNPGFGFATSPSGHVKIPQLGRVIVQDGVEIGACATIDRGALGDTVIGEGTKIDNLTQIGHNTIVGRHCVIVAQVGISGSCELGDFVVIGGQAGLADHVRIGDGARLAGRTGVTSSLEGGIDYGGTPAKPVKQWAREIAAVSALAKKGAKLRDE